MIEIGAFNAQSSVSTLLRATRVAAPEPSTSSLAPASKAVPPATTHSYRLASQTEASIFDLDLAAVGDGREDIGAALAGVFEEFLEIFHGRGKAGEALESALSSVSHLIDAAAEGADVVGVQLRLTSVVRSFGVENGAEAAYGSVTGFAIEVGLVRGRHVSTEDVQLLGLGGERLELSSDQRRTGIVDGLYRIEDEAPFSAEIASLRGENKAQVEALRNALDRLRLVQDALSAYRRGDDRALEEVEKFFRSGTLDAGAVRAISDVRGTNQTVVPGSGVISFS